ncbi:N-6 DNA methylase [Natrinema zhouii]|uniref:site-specific DNA-methyltransferase (adenine-specific) n=1 Tax=Natrinema zhouii TaxID=1710539 RepID=A0A7D6GJS5_9EURY|nr:N-6 DNA methylase [Natrinema zhouii]QLK25539.1 N-6 DNA methylase [Natrinema zhouii]
MRDQELVRDTVHELTEIYGEDRVVVEPFVEGKLSFRPDIAVLDEQLDEFYVVVECSTVISEHREREDLKELRRLMDHSGAPYGALVSESFEYVFKLVPGEEGEQVEREIAGFPRDNGQERRALESAEEVRMKFWRLADYFRGKMGRDIEIHLYHSLFRKLAAERHNYNLDIDTLSEKDLKELDQLIEEEYPPFKSQGRALDVEFQEQVLNTFYGIDLDKTPPKVAEAFVELEEQEKTRSQTTPIWLGEALLDLSEIGEGDLVLDPAAGYGNILRQASARGADAHGVEINIDAVNSAIFLNELFGSDVSYTAGDYLKLSQIDHSLPAEFDQVFIDPPFNLHYEKPDGTPARNGDEKFVLDSLERLKPGGRLTVILPIGKLYKRRSSDFRETLRSEYRIESLIEVNAPVYDHTGVSTVILKIANEPSSPSDKISYGIVDSDDDPEQKIPEVVDDIRLGKADTLELSRLEGRSYLPSEIIQMDETSRKLQQRYAEVREIQDVAEEIRGGTKKPDQVFEEDSDHRLPYVNIRDIQQEKYSEFVDVSDNIVRADETDVLVSATGSKIHIHHPEEEIAPSSMWAVVRFRTEEEALVYAHFLDTELSRKQLESMQGGATIQHIPIRRLRELLVPEFSEAEIQDKAESIRKRLDKITDLEQEQEQLQDDLEGLFGGD